ncbi:MAG: H(+)-transporting ATPase, partial [Clostridia bacterium]|nr:H(+)-transporting ATPase [Clostridia bacterium]
FMLPNATKDGVSLKYIDALYTATSAVCVTGLSTVDAGSTFSAFGQTVLCALIQIGGLGVTAVGAGVIIAVGKKVDLRGRTLLRESMNLDSLRGVVKLLRNIFIFTLIIEAAGALLSFPVFIKDYPLPRAIGLSVFHSIATFNNSGFDVFGKGNSLVPYASDVQLNLVTCALIFFGGIGFLVIKEVVSKRFKWRKFSMHTKVVLSVSAALLAVGTVVFKLTEGISWLEAVFASFTSRTAGFATVPMADFSHAGLLFMNLLMFIGASPGSTGGGIKTTTFFVLIVAVIASATNRSENAFHFAIPKTAFRKASVIVLIALAVILVSTFMICIFDPELSLEDVLFEMTSAFATVGLSTGITPSLSLASKIVSVFVMYIGRLGPLTVATLWYYSKGERISHPEGNLTIG